MFALEYHHKFRTEDIENWIVFERDIKLEMLHNYLEYRKQLEKDLAS